MASLTGTKIKDTYDSLLKVSDNGALDGTLQTITDGVGNNSALSLSTAGASVGGTLAVSGAATLSSTLAVTGVSTLTGNVGIGTGTITGYSNKILHIAGTDGAELHITTNGSGGLQSDGLSIGLRDSDGSVQISQRDNSFMAFATNDTERMRIKSDGDISFRDSSANEAFYWDASAASLGIGTSPNRQFHIYGGSAPTTWLLMNNSATGSASTDGFSIAQTGADVSFINREAGYIDFQTSDVPRMRIDSSGNVGIKVTPPAWGTAANYGALQLANASFHFRQNSAELYIANNTYYDGSAYKYLQTDAAARYDQVNGVHSWYTAPTGTAGASATFTERMRITSGGFTKASTNGVYFNGSYHEFSNNNNVSGDRCLVVGNKGGSNTNNTASILFIVADTDNDRMVVYGNGNVANLNNSYGAISDIKVKENITDATPKLDKLMQVRIRNYNLIGEELNQIGVVAQELEEVFPSMIDESPDYEEVEVPQLDENGQEVLDENGEVVMTKERVDLGTVTKSVKYSVFVPILIKAMQEQQEIINDLKARIEQLEA